VIDEKGFQKNPAVKPPGGLKSFWGLYYFFIPYVNTLSIN
jgi:hypothetical protein